MWNEEASKEGPGWQMGAKAAVIKKASLQILPCTVSQLLSASPDHNEAFVIGDLELNQVSLVGIVRGSSPCATYNQYFVDDMTGPPLTVCQWSNTDDPSDQAGPEPGVYVKVHGSMRIFHGKKSLLAMNIRCVKDLNEITSHMLEVVYAHKQLFGKGCDVNMNALTGSDAPQTSSEEYMAPGLSTIQGQVIAFIFENFQMYNRFFPSGARTPLKELLHLSGTFQVLQVISQHSVKREGISFQDLVTLLDYIGIQEIRKSLAVLINEGHVYYTIDENHFKSSAD